MTADAYRLLAMFVRYWFVFLMCMITFRAFRWLYKERKAYQKTLKVLPDAGLIGELVDLKTGETYPLPREGCISGRRLADVSLRGYKYQRIAFELEKGKGIALTPLKRGHRPSLDGEVLHGTAYALHGSELDLGDRTLKFRLFAGLDVPSRGMVYQEAEHWAQEAALSPDMWAMDPSFWPENQMQPDAPGMPTPVPYVSDQPEDDTANAGYALLPPESPAVTQPITRKEEGYGSAKE